MAKEKQKGTTQFLSPLGHVRDRIRIYPAPDIPKEGIFFSLNGYAYLAKAGVDIDLPRPVREMLDTRIKTETYQDEDGTEHTRDAPRYPYILIKEDVDGILNPAPPDVSQQAGG